MACRSRWMHGPWNAVHCFAHGLPGCSSSSKMPAWTTLESIAAKHAANLQHAHPNQQHHVYKTAAAEPKPSLAKKNTQSPILMFKQPRQLSAVAAHLFAASQSGTPQQSPTPTHWRPRHGSCRASPPGAPSRPRPAPLRHAGAMRQQPQQQPTGAGLLTG